MAIIVLGAVPFIGIGWLSALHSVALSVLILLPAPWSLGIFAGLVVAPLPLAFALGAPDLGAYYSVVVAWRTLAPFTVIWLVSAIRQLETARQSLAQEAVTRERLRIDAELRRALGGSLEAIAADAEQASALVRQSPSSVEELLRATVERSRRTLAQVRRMVSSYQHLSLRAELDAAAALLNAAGIATHVEFPDDDFPSSVEASLHAELRSATARLLRDEATRSCVIVVAHENGRPRLELRSDTGPRPTGRITS
jgi:signal transduction histidine kinase